MASAHALLVDRLQHRCMASITVRAHKEFVLLQHLHQCVLASGDKPVPPHACMRAPGLARGCMCHVRVTVAVSPPAVINHEHMHREAMHELHRRRAEEQATATLLRSIDTANDPFKWRDAQRMAADELGVHDGLVFVERERLRFIELGGGELPPCVSGQRVLQPGATGGNDEALAPDDEARVAQSMASAKEPCVLPVKRTHAPLSE